MEANMSYQSLTGFGYHTAKEVEELQKALSVGSDYAVNTPGNLTGGGALSVEDLDRTLKLVTASLEHLRLWKDVIKQKVAQTVHEFNVQNSYGAELSPFFAMGGNPTATDAQYNRDVFIVKYLGTQGSVQHNLTLIQAAHGPVVAREVKNKTIELLMKNERAMFDASSAIQANEYDGVDAQLRSKSTQAKYISTAFVGYQTATDPSNSVIVDLSQNALAGATPTEDDFEEACLVAINNFGYPMDMYMSSDIHSAFSRSFYAKERTIPGGRTAAGYLIPEFMGSLNFRFKPSVFNRPRIIPLASAIGAESAPVISSTSVATDAASNFGASYVGTYSYVISAVYADGETLPATHAEQAVTAGKSVSAVLTYSGAPLYFIVFRAPVGTTAGHQFIGRIAPPTGGSGNAAVIDQNLRQPGTHRGYLLMHDPDVLVWKQLGSLIKYDLAVTNTSYQWLQLLYGGILITAPRKNVIIDNMLRISPY